jgi:hypothetical protein
MKYYKVIEPNWDLSENERFKPENGIETIWTEEDILLERWVNYKQQMEHKFGKDKILKKQDCIDEWASVNWAQELWD